jgi:hypothetical protein
VLKIFFVVPFKDFFGELTHGWNAEKLDWRIRELFGFAGEPFFRNFEFGGYFLGERECSNLIFLAYAGYVDVW